MATVFTPTYSFTYFFFKRQLLVHNPHCEKMANSHDKPRGYSRSSSPSRVL